MVFLVGVELKRDCLESLRYPLLSILRATLIPSTRLWTYKRQERLNPSPSYLQADRVVSGAE
jgi:hypothetical protein